MANWKQTVKIKYIFKDENSDSKECAKNLLEVLGKTNLQKHVYLSRAISKLQNVETEQDFNIALDSLYDYGDVNGVWFQ